MATSSAADEPPAVATTTVIVPAEPALSLVDRTGDLANDVVDGVNKTIDQTIGQTRDVVDGVNKTIGLTIGQTIDVVDGVNKTIGRAIDYVGTRYKRGGLSPETGFDCSGFVSHVFREGLGLVLPHNAKAMSRSGDVIRKDQLQPGDLVFFNTMRRAFSHVGIYLGENRFIHAPAPGGEVRVEDMGSRYWVARFNGARRVSVE